MIGNNNGNTNQLDLAKSSRADAFGRQIVSQYRAQAAWKFSDNINLNLYKITTENGGTVTHEDGFAKLETGTNAAGRAKIETKKLVIYQPGYAGEATFTYDFDEPKADTKQIAGLGNDTDGLFISYENLDFCAIVRNNGLDTIYTVEQFTDGLFVNYTPQKGNVYRIAYQWLGFGQIAFYIEFPEIGGFRIFHRVKYANTSDVTSLRNPSLPLMAEVRNTGNTTNITGRTPSATAGVYGEDNTALVTLDGLDIQDKAYASASGEIPVITLKNNTDYAGGTGNNRAPLRITSISLAATNNNVRSVTYRLKIGGTLTLPTFTDINTNTTPGQKDVVASAISGGTFNFPITITANTASQTIDLTPLKIDIPPGETFTVTAEAAVDINQLSVGIGYANLF